MTDTLTVGSITQLTHDGRGHRWIWRAEPLFEDEVDMAQFAKPDPRDARIAELEAALRTIVDGGSIQDVWITAYRALYPFSAPERDMCITHEELPA